MPFQGNPNAGAPDPALINMLFQQKQRREELAWEREKYQIEAQRQAQLDAADQARKDREHRLKAAGQLFDIQSKVQDRAKTLGSAQADAEEQMGAVEQQYPVSDYAQPAFAPIEQRPAGLFPLEAPDLQNVGVQSQVASQLMGPIDAQRASIENTLADIPELESLRSSIPEQGNLSERLRARTAGIKAAEYDRQFGMQKSKEESAATTANNRAIARLDHAAEIAAEADVRKIKTREKELQGLANRLANPKVTGPERELVESQYKAIKAEANADLTRSQAPEVVTENRRRAQENFEYDQVYDQNRSVRELVQRLESGDTSAIGVEGWAAEVLGNFKDVVETASSIPFFDRYQATLETVLNNPANTDEEKQQIIDTFFSQDALDRVAAGQLTEQEMRWWFMYSLNPDGRVSNMLSQETRKRSDIIGPGVGPKMALSRLRAMEQRQSQYLKRKQAYTKKVDPSEAFDPTDNRRIGSNSLPLGAGPSAAPKRAAVTKPRMSPQDAAAAIQQQGAGR